MIKTCLKTVSVLSLSYMMVLLASAGAIAADAQLPSPTVAAQPGSAPSLPMTGEESPPEPETVFDYFRHEGLRQIDEGTIKDVLKADMVMLDNSRRYRLDNVRVPTYDENAIIDKLKKMFVGKSVKIFSYHEPSAFVDRYGLPWAHVVTDDGVWMQNEAIAEGLMWAYSTETSPLTVQYLKRVEEKARQAEKGFWSDPAYTVKAPEALADSIDSFQIVEGKIVSVADKGGKVFFNFGKDWKTDFTVKIVGDFGAVFPEDVERTALQKTINVMKWKNRIVRVRGWVTENNGPMIEVTHREQIDIIRDSKK